MKVKTINDTYKPIGGLLCLDYVNTIGGIRGGTIIEYLSTYADLVYWAELVHIINRSDREELLRISDEQEDEQQKVFNRAIILREAIHRILISKISNKDPFKEDIDILNSELLNANKNKMLGYSNNKYYWQWVDKNKKIDSMLWSIVESASQILIQESLPKIQICDNETCGWMFIDQTRNKNRRWCDMSSCGNRSKQKKYQQKKESLR